METQSSGEALRECRRVWPDLRLPLQRARRLHHWAEYFDGWRPLSWGVLITARLSEFRREAHGYRCTWLTIRQFVLIAHLSNKSTCGYRINPGAKRGVISRDRSSDAGHHLGDRHRYQSITANYYLQSRVANVTESVALLVPFVTFTTAVWFVSSR